MRALVALLLVANLGFFALAQGWLEPYATLSTRQQREPQRQAAQIEPERVRVLDAQAASAALRSAETSCLLAGPFSAMQIEAVEAALAPLQPPPVRQRAPSSTGAGAEPLWLRVDRADNSTRERLLRITATVPGGSVKPCP